MAARRKQKASDRRSQTERYRRAAQLAIEQLDWCTNYMLEIRKPGIAKALRRNRNTIVKRYEL